MMRRSMSYSGHKHAPQHLADVCLAPRKRTSRDLCAGAETAERVSSFGKMIGSAYLYFVPYLRLIALMFSRVNSLRGSPGRLQVSRKNASKPVGVTIQR